MKHQFLYGRTRTGYCQLNQEYFIQSKRDLMQLEALQNYLLADGSDMQNLPLEYYAYTDEIGGERVWVEGLTSFVPAGTSHESGSRDTSMIHKYIYSGEDYWKHVWAEAENEGRKFCRTVEEYQQETGDDIESGCREIEFASLQQYFGFNEDQLADFIICCMDVFPTAEKRVYCYLPSVDRTGSQYAKCLMESLLKVLPPCVNVGAGFITYSSSFHNISVNPIPGNISVVFIPDTLENRQREISEKNKNYIFDFKNYERQNRMDTIEYIKPMAEDIVKDMKFGHREKNISFYDKLLCFVRNDVAVGADFLGFFRMYLSLKGTIQKNFEIIKYTIAKAIGKLLEFESTLTESGKSELFRDVDVMLQCCQYSEKDLEWINYIYESGELCRGHIAEYLCNVCLKCVMELPDNWNEKIFMIVNFEYRSEELKSDILSLIYSKEKYFQVGQRLIFEMLKPLKEDSEKTDAKKRTLFFTSVAGMYKEYPEFVISPYFRNEAADFLMDFLQNADDMKKEMTAFRGDVEGMDEVFQRAYYPVLQMLSYFEVRKFIFSEQRRKAEEGELEYYGKLILQYRLKEYEKENLTRPCINLLEDTIRERKFDKVLASENVQAVLRTFEMFSFEKAVDYCKRNKYKAERCLDYCETIGEQEFTSDWKDLLCYFYCTEDSTVMERCLSLILKQENLTCLVKFCRNAHEKMHTRESVSERRAVHKVIESHREDWLREEILVSDMRALVAMVVEGILRAGNHNSDSGYCGSRENDTVKPDRDFDYDYDYEHDYDRKEDCGSREKYDEADPKDGFTDQDEAKSKQSKYVKAEKKKSTSRTGKTMVDKILKRN